PRPGVAIVRCWNTCPPQVIIPPKQQETNKIQPRASPKPSPSKYPGCCKMVNTATGCRNAATPDKALGLWEPFTCTPPACQAAMVDVKNQPQPHIRPLRGV